MGSETKNQNAQVSGGSISSKALMKKESTFADDTSVANATPLDKYEDTKKMLQKTGVKFIPRKRIQFDESIKGKDYINAGTFGSVYRCRVKGRKGLKLAVKIINGHTVRVYICG